MTHQLPALRIVRGEPSPEELAALVAVLSSASGGGTATPVPVREWARPSRGVGGVGPHRLRGWRSSALPR